MKHAQAVNNTGCNLKFITTREAWRDGELKSSARPADLFPTGSLVFHIELKPRARTGLDVAEFHFLKLPLPVHFFERLRVEFLQ